MLASVLLLPLLGRGAGPEDRATHPASAATAISGLWEAPAKILAASEGGAEAGGRYWGAIYEVTGQLLMAAANSTPDRGAAVRNILLASKNPVVRQCAAGAEARAALKTVPIAMKFVALDGQVVDLEKMRGHVILIDFRGLLHCAACTEGEPMLKEVYRKYHSQGFEIVTIANDSFADYYEGRNTTGLPPPTFDLVKAKDRRYIREHGLEEWPTYSDGKGYSPFPLSPNYSDPNPFFKRYNIEGTPTYFLIDRNGLLDSEPNYYLLTVPGFLERWVKEALSA